MVRSNVKKSSRDANTCFFCRDPTPCLLDTVMLTIKGLRRCALNFGFSLVGVNFYCSTQVQRMVEADFTSKLREYDASIMPAAPSPAYLNSEKVTPIRSVYLLVQLTIA
jgi:hypothetical protein